jgi:opacity protein-like surface antigen
MLAGASLLAIVLSSNLARADGYYGGGPALRCVPNYIVESNNQLRADYKAVNFDYKETGDGRFGTATGVLDTENGWVSGFGVSLSVMPACTHNWLLENLYFSVEYSHYKGHTDYVGSLIGGVFGSVRQQDGATVNDYDIRLGKGFVISRDLMLTPYFGIGHHEWDRKVNEGEDYKNGYYGAGLLLQYSPFARAVLSLDGLIGRTFDSHIDVAGPFGFSGDLGNSTLYRVGLSGDYGITRNLHVNAGVEWTGFDYGASANFPIPGGVAWEPDSRTRNTTVRVGVGYAFGGDRDNSPLK